MTIFNSYVSYYQRVSIAYSTSVIFHSPESWRMRKGVRAYLNHPLIRSTGPGGVKSPMIHDLMQTILCLHERCMIITRYSSARPAPGGSFETFEMTIGNPWPLGKCLRCRNQELLTLWGVSLNEQMVLAMTVT